MNDKTIVTDTMANSVVEADFERLNGCVKACGFDSLESAVEHLANTHLATLSQQPAQTDVEGEREAIVEYMISDANGWRGPAYSEGTVHAIKLLADEIKSGAHLTKDKSHAE